MFDEIIVFLQLAELNSFHKTSKKLNMSPATVTRRIAALENRLNVKLLKRNTRTLSLTQDGWHCYEKWKTIPQMIFEVKKDISNAKALVQGEVNFSVSAYSGFYELVPIVSDFLQLHPKIKVNFVKSNIHPEIIDDSYDVFFRHGEVNTRVFQSKKLNSYELITIASPQYLRRHKNPIKLNDLATHNCIIHCINAHEGRIWQYRQNNRHLGVKISGNISLNNAVLVLEAVLAGVGLARLPRYYVESYLTSGKLVEVLGEYAPAPLPCYLVYPRSEYTKTRIQLFADFIIQAYKSRHF